MKTKTTSRHSRKPRHSRAWNLIGTLIAVAALIGAVQALAPVPAMAMMDIGCEEVGDCPGGGDGSGPDNDPWEGGWEVGEDEGPEQDTIEAAEREETEFSDAENKQLEEKEIADAEEPERVFAEERQKVEELSKECDALWDEAIAVEEAGDQAGSDTTAAAAFQCSQGLVSERQRLGIPEKKLIIGPVTVTPLDEPPPEEPETKLKKRPKKKGARQRADKLRAAR